MVNGENEDSKPDDLVNPIWKPGTLFKLALLNSEWVRSRSFNLVNDV